MQNPDYCPRCKKHFTDHADDMCQMVPIYSHEAGAEHDVSHWVDTRPIPVFALYLQ